MGTLGDGNWIDCRWPECRATADSKCSDSMHVLSKYVDSLKSLSSTGALLQLVHRCDEGDGEPNGEEDADLGAECDLLVSGPGEGKVMVVVTGRPGDGRSAEGADTLAGSGASENSEIGRAHV